MNDTHDKPGFTEGPWRCYLMTDADTGEPLTPEQVGEYVTNTITKTAEDSGHTDFLFVSAETPDGDRDIAHVGNGPRSPMNARLIAQAPEMFRLLTAIRQADEEALNSPPTPRGLNMEQLAAIDRIEREVRGE